MKAEFGGLNAAMVLTAAIVMDNQCKWERVMCAAVEAGTDPMPTPERIYERFKGDVLLGVARRVAIGLGASWWGCGTA